MSPLPEIKCYPAPVASHDEVVNKPGLFWDTLKNFHSSFGTKFMVPVIGGKELDLHLLYVEVTKKGGYDKVVLEKKWREISSVFSFAPTATSASFVLKKHYQSLLYHYEQSYFFKSEGPLTKASLPHGHVSGPDTFNNEDFSKNYNDLPDSPGEGPMSFLAEGTIDGKFDCGYLISMKMGTRVLRGVLYHPQKPATSSPDAVDLSLAIVPYDPKAPPRTRRRRFKKKRWGGDPTHPKPNRSGYNFFFAERHAVLKSLHPNREREFTKMIGEAWNNLSATERQVYQKIGLEDKERYQRELKEYKERKLGQL